MDAVDVLGDGVGHVNLLYEPIEKMTVGGEIMYAERTLENSDSGDMMRLLFSAKYAF